MVLSKHTSVSRWSLCLCSFSPARQPETWNGPDDFLVKTLEELAALLDQINKGDEAVFNFALHDFVRYLLEYRKGSKTAADMLRLFSKEEK